MTNQRELDRVLAAYLAEGTNELADRVIDAALDQIDHTPQRRALRMPRRFSTMTMPMRLAAAAFIGVLLVGGSLYLNRLNQPLVGGPSARPGASATLGEPTSPAPSGTPTIAPPRAASWTATGNMSRPRWDGRAVLLQDGRVLVVGGNSNIADPAAEVYDPRTGTWTATGAMVASRMQFAAVRLLDGRVLVAGGAEYSLAGGVLASAELYDPGTGSWAATGSLGTARFNITATLLPDGRVLVAGGNILTAESSTPAVASAELYDPGTGTWTATGSMGTARNETATLLRDGKVLVVGAIDDGSPTSAELYDPHTGTWVPTGDLTKIRTPLTATLLGDGRVLVVGQIDHSSPAELYDPGTGTWNSTGSLIIPHGAGTATLLSDGRVLVVGGVSVADRCATRLASAELYDPRTGTWGATSDMIQGRSGHTATLLPDGRVLVASGVHSGRGGVPCGPGLDLLSSAELYDPGSPR